ncbi:DUF1152 domain-containing protein [Persicimonas caeni]|uniref:DUF1152 domain-containing protein n=1 Tax=Persicimonas caeni TaxID=2292766 RepID=A0A4Y6PZ26_PERCE|nr:DUF1152 domain-containing protein [Persicimonas caeni]QDG53419.1 DUF1152 domain-containing protein [Persicimonas caeni]QED34640.1 DUF1152 domain-containing protein [Persicimonas caeni]
MDLLRQPVLDRLRDAKSVLIAGAGGGFDLFSGLPIYFALREAGKTVHLANLSFSALAKSDAVAHDWGVYEVDARTQGNPDYFPERYLAQWLEAHDDPTPVFCIERRGYEAVKKAYELLAATLEFDTLVLVDGGTDSLMRGDEAGLGTPAEDVMSLLAGARLELDDALLICLGFGIDHYHGVCHAQFLEAVAELTRTGGYLGAFALTQQMPAVKRYMEATDWVQGQTPGRESIVSASIIDALEGHYGDHHRLERTRGSRLWINPLMTLYWCFELDAVASRILYADWLENTWEFGEVLRRIEAFRKTVDVRGWDDIPI